jgi:hypothetical protein
MSPPCLAAKAGDISTSVRGGARDFFTGSPDYNIATISGGQYNVAATGGIVLRWR